MQSTGAAMLGAGRLVLIAVRGRMREVAFLDEMERILHDFAQCRDERPDKHHGDSNCRETFHYVAI